jgi:hypothetical protein
LTRYEKPVPMFLRIASAYQSTIPFCSLPRIFSDWKAQ